MTKPEKICWIDTVAETRADAELAEIYDTVRGKNGQLDNLYQAFSLRPHTIRPADDLYLAAMHTEANTLAKRFSELIGTYVAILTGCEYAETHHGHNFRHLHGETQGASIIACLKKGELESCGNAAEVAALRYVAKLVRQPQSMRETDVTKLKVAGWSDGEVLEIVQVVAMFSYFVRVINGVGIQLGDETPGLY